MNRGRLGRDLRIELNSYSRPVAVMGYIWRLGPRMAIVSLLISIQAVAYAGDRKFAFSYEVTTAPPGSVEYEQYVTWKKSKKTDSDFDRFEFRHELEFGLTEKLQMGIYLADWRYQDATQSTMRSEQGHLARSRLRPEDVVTSPRQWAQRRFT